MIINMETELRDYLYITNLYKCITNYHRQGHQIGRKIGDMLELLTLGVIYKKSDLKKHLITEGKLTGYSSANHNVEFCFFQNPKDEENLFGAIECKCVGVETTKSKSITLKNPGEFFNINLSGKWTSFSTNVACTIKDISTTSVEILLTNSAGDAVPTIYSLSVGQNIKLILDEHNNFICTTPNCEDMLTEVPQIIRICKIIELSKISNNSCIFNLYNCIPGPQTIEKAKQASLVAIDLRKKIDNIWNKTDLPSEQKKMTFIHVICEASHWGNKSKDIISTYIDYNLIVPDAIMIYAFKKFENIYGSEKMLKHIKKSQFKKDFQLQKVISNILDHFDNHIFYDLETGQYVTLTITNNKLCIQPI